MNERLLELITENLDRSVKSKDFGEVIGRAQRRFEAIMARISQFDRTEIEEIVLCNPMSLQMSLRSRCFEVNIACLNALLPSGDQFTYEELVLKVYKKNPIALVLLMASSMFSLIAEDLAQACAEQCLHNLDSYEMLWEGGATDIALDNVVVTLGKGCLPTIITMARKFNRVRLAAKFLAHG